MRQKSPCVQDCPDRLPCGACRKSCEAFQEYEKERLERKTWQEKPVTAGRKAMIRNGWRYSQRGKNHMR